MLGSGNHGPTAPDGDAPRMPDDVDPATPYGPPMIPDDTLVIPDVADSVIPVPDAQMTPGADVPMTPDAGAPKISSDTAPRTGCHLGVFFGVLISQVSSSENRNGSLSVYAKSTHMGGLPPMLPWRPCCRTFLRRVNWISHWRPRDAVHLVRPEPKEKGRPRANQQLRPQVK